jgi:OOP family OmpA-OmpF porin
MLDLSGIPDDPVCNHHPPGVACAHPYLGVGAAVPETHWIALHRTKKGGEMRLIGAIATAAFVLCGLISATQASAQGQFYLGASGGRSDLSERIAAPFITSGAVDYKSVGGKIFVGYQFNEYFGLDVAYVDLGKVRYNGDFSGSPVTNGKVEVTGVNYSLVGTLPVSPAWAIFVKAGMFAADVKASDTTGGVPFSQTISNSSDSVGLGVSYNITKNISARAEWERLKIDINNAAARLWSFGYVIKF